jgi:hypothetical protein
MFEKREPVHPYDPEFQQIRDKGIPRLTTNDCLRILEANQFTDITLYHSTKDGTAKGPDGRTYYVAEVLMAILKIERLERLCQDRSDAVVGLLNRKEAWGVFRGPDK